MFSKTLMLISLIFNMSVALAVPQNEAQNVQDILNDVNAYRKSIGLPSLQLRDDLSREALKHSQDMAAHRVPFGHDGFQTRLKHMYAHAKRPNGAAENVAYHYKNGHIVVKNWLTSPHHRANIRGHYNYTGIGLARDEHGQLYFTQVFLQEG